MHDRKLRPFHASIKFLHFYDTYEDQIYSYSPDTSTPSSTATSSALLNANLSSSAAPPEKTQSKLHFRVAGKYNIPIPQDNYQKLSSLTASESKVAIPPLHRAYPKPRDKRHHRKHIRELLKQES